MLLLASFACRQDCNQMQATVPVGPDALGSQLILRFAHLDKARPWLTEPPPESSWPKPNHSSRPD